MSFETLIPDDFLHVPATLPRGETDVLGYGGSARFVGFYWESAADVLAWYDGRSLVVGQGEPNTFSRLVLPLAYVHGANLGGRGEATHFFIWDRLAQAAYVAPWGSALDFLTGQNVLPALAATNETGLGSAAL